MTATAFTILPLAVMSSHSKLMCIDLYSILLLAVV
jgi:hypothetical protein